MKILRSRIHSPLSHTQIPDITTSAYISDRESSSFITSGFPRMHQKKKKTTKIRRRRIWRSYHIFAKMFKSRRPFVVQRTRRASMQLNRNTKSLEVVKSLTTAAMAEEGSARDTRQQRPFLSLFHSFSRSACTARLQNLKFCPQYCPSPQWNRY